MRKKNSEKLNTELREYQQYRRNKRKRPANLKEKKRLNKKIKIFFKILAFIFFITLIGSSAYAAYVIKQAPQIDPSKMYDILDESTQIYDDKDNVIDAIYMSENRRMVTYEEIPKNLINAFVAIEDKTFWKHHGFNFKRIIGAVIESLNGGRISGTSTITQQLARNVFLKDIKSDRNIKRKITEMYYAYKIEKSMSKEDILTAYLNTIYLGYGCYGVNTAARSYFNCDISDLTLSQCAALAALPKAPADYSLLTNEEGENTVKLKDNLYANDASCDRRSLVLKLMHEQQYIKSDERKEADKPLTEFIKPATSTSQMSAFKDYLITTVIDDIAKKYNMSEEDARNMVYKGGLDIHSTLNINAQKKVMSEFKDDANFPKAVKSGENVEAAMVITEVGTGKIKAMVGTRKNQGEMLFNRADNPRQPGSSVKPLTVYAAALQRSFDYASSGQKFQYVNTGYDKQGISSYGNYLTASSIINDEKMVVNGKVWPYNFSRTYSGRNTFRTAIQQSINTCAVKIVAQVGIDYSAELLHKFGITTEITDKNEETNDMNLAALSLGAMAYGVKPLDMALAYATFPNGGVRNSGLCYTKVFDSDGKLLLEAKSEETKVLDEGVAWIMTDVLKSVVSRGIASNASIKNIAVGGKTGTTNDTYDIWFNGFTPSYSAALWIGTDNNVEMNASSSQAAALWSKIMGGIEEAKKGEYKSRPSNVITVNGEYYTKGTEPSINKADIEKNENQD